MKEDTGQSAIRPNLSQPVFDWILLLFCNDVKRGRQAGHVDLCLAAVTIRSAMPVSKGGLQILNNAGLQWNFCSVHWLCCNFKSVPIESFRLGSRCGSSVFGHQHWGSALSHYRWKWKLFYFGFWAFTCWRLFHPGSTLENFYLPREEPSQLHCSTFGAFCF